MVLPHLVSHHIAPQTLGSNIVVAPTGSDSKESACNEGDRNSTPGSGRSPGEKNGNPLQYSCLENPMGREACQAIVPGVA